VTHVGGPAGAVPPRYPSPLAASPAAEGAASPARPAEAAPSAAGVEAVLDQFVAASGLAFLAGRAAARAVAAAAELPVPSGAAAPEAGPAPWAPGPGAYDAARIDPAQLAALRSSADPRDRRMAQTLRNAQRRYAALISGGGRVVVSAGAGNGGQPVVTLVAPGFDPSRPARVHTHYHGWSTTVAGPGRMADQRTDRIEKVQARDPQTVVVLPECASAPVGYAWNAPPAYKTDWSNVSSQARTVDDALRAAGVEARIEQEVVSAHSGGGRALVHAIRAQTDGSGLRAQRLELMDCLYEDTDALLRQWGGGASPSANGSALESVVYYLGTNEAHKYARMARDFGARYELRRVGDHNRTALYLDADTPPR
jgi:hypothetical protein